MAAYRLARREPPSRAIAALQLLTRILPLPASRVSPKAPAVGALARLGGSESVNIRLKEYQPTKSLNRQSFYAILRGSRQLQYITLSTPLA
jgi:hypothetical protein